MENQIEFTPPTIEQIENFIDDRGLNIDGEQFYFYYAARGWYMGNGILMADWKAALYCWAIQQRTWAQSSQPHSDWESRMRKAYDDSII